MASIDTISRNLMLNSLKQYAKKNLPLDLLQEFDHKNDYPAEVIKDFFDPEVLGINYLMLPPEYGGLSGAGIDVYRICEALGRIDLGLATIVFATFLGTDPIRVGATPEQKKKWLNLIAEKRWVVAYGATEADAGSDLVSLKTRAERVEENGKIIGYKISGNKQWISNGGIAQLYTILALAPGGASWFIVERDTEGFSADKHEDKHGIRLSNTTGLALDEVFVPVEHLVGGVEGQGLVQAQAVFGYTRLMVAAMGLGAGEEALECAIRYSQQRIQAGGPLSEKMGYMHKLIVPHAINFEAARSIIEKTSIRLDKEGEGLQTEGAIAKFYATEAADDAAEDSIQALGGYGYTKEFLPEKTKRDTKITNIYEGTSEILQMTIYRNRWQEHLKSRGQYYANMGNECDAIHQKNQNLGADSMGIALRGLANLMESCRIQRLTRHQYVTFKLGELITKAEVSHCFIQTASQDPYSDSIRFDKETYEAMARVHARRTAMEIITEGLQLILGAGTEDANTLAANSGLIAIMDKQRGITQDMDFIAEKLCEVFNAK